MSGTLPNFSDEKKYEESLRVQFPFWKKCISIPVEKEYREVMPNEKGVETLEGYKPVSQDEHYIMRGVAGELYPIRKDIFKRTFKVKRPNRFLQALRSSYSNIKALSSKQRYSTSDLLVVAALFLFAGTLLGIIIHFTYAMP